MDGAGKMPLLLVGNHSLTLAKVIFLRMLGYGVAVPEWGSVYGPAETTDVFQFTEVSCKGDEQNLLDCSLKFAFLLHTLCLLPCTFYCTEMC